MKVRTMKVRINQYVSGRIGLSPSRTEKVRVLKKSLASGQVLKHRRPREMTPIERAEAVVEIARLEAMGCVDHAQFRADVLRGLREFAARESWSVSTLREIGFSDADLVEAGVIPPLIPQISSSRVLARATAEWRREVREPPGRGWQRIDEYIRGPEGLGWPSAALSGSSDSKSYTRNRQFQWCGAFAAFCHLEVDADLRKHHFASVYRLDQWSRGNARRIAPSDLIPGDIVIVGPKAAGAHVTICLSIPSPQTIIETIEGNATGTGPDGEKYEGVIRTRRPLTSADPREYRVHYGVRPEPGDLVEAGVIPLEHAPDSPPRP